MKFYDYFAKNYTVDGKIWNVKPDVNMLTIFDDVISQITKGELQFDDVKIEKNMIDLVKLDANNTKIAYRNSIEKCLAQVAKAQLGIDNFTLINYSIGRIGDKFLDEYKEKGSYVDSVFDFLKKEAKNYVENTSLTEENGEKRYAYSTNDARKYQSAKLSFIKTELTYSDISNKIINTAPNFNEKVERFFDLASLSDKYFADAVSMCSKWLKYEGKENELYKQIDNLVKSGDLDINEKRQRISSIFLGLSEEKQERFTKSLISGITHVLKGGVADLNGFALRDDFRNVFESFCEKRQININDVMPNSIKAYVNLEKGDEALDAVDDEDKVIIDNAKNEIVAQIESLKADGGREHSKEIDELIEKADVLEKAKKAVVLSSNGELNRLFGVTMTEAIGTVTDEKRMNNIKDYVNDNLRKNTAIEFNKRSVSLNPDVDIKEASSQIKDLLSKKVKIPDKTKKDLKNIFKYLKESGIYNKESANKICMPKQAQTVGFKDLQEKRENITKLIKDNKPANEIEEAIKDYNDFSEKVEKARDMCRELSPTDDIPSNFSANRNMALPSKFKYEIVGGTRFTCSYSLLTIAERTGVDIDEVVDNPIEGYKKIVNAIFNKDDKYIKSVKNADSLYDSLVNAQPNRPGKDGDSVLNDNLSYGYISNIDPMAKLMDFIALSIPDEKVRKELSSQIMTYAGCVSVSYESAWTQLKASFYNIENSVIENMLVVNKEDRNPLRLSMENNYLNANTLEPEEKFDRVKYFKEKTDVKQFAKNMSDLNKKLNSKDDRLLHKERFVSATATIKGEVDKFFEKSTSAKAIIGNAFKGKNISEQDLKTLDREKQLISVYDKEMLSEKDIQKAMKILAESRVDYQKKNIFQRWFGSETKRQAKSIDTLVSNLQKRGMSKNEINRISKEMVTQIKNGNLQGIDDIVNDFAKVNSQTKEVEVKETNNRTNIVIESIEKEEQIEINSALENDIKAYEKDPKAKSVDEKEVENAIVVLQSSK